MLRVAVKLVLILLLVYAGVYAGYGQLEKRFLVTPSAAGKHAAVEKKPVKQISQTLQKTTNYQIIVARNIFEAVLEKKAPPMKKVPVVVEKEPEPTKLKLILQGTVTGSDQDARAIIIDQKKKKQDIYQIGDAVAGALVTAIERGKVVLEVNGKKQFLQIKDRQGGGPGASGGSYTAPRASTFVMKSSRTAYSKKRATPVPAVKPHRRISFKQDPNKDDEDGAIEPDEPEEPSVDEDPPENGPEAEIPTE